ncbi:MAG: hypothetical protein FWE64_00780 [Alphaproteobacteria bacterium]|nr:hypothetical protein [Alphaproteobacteria bacterium]
MKFELLHEVRDYCKETYNFQRAIFNESPRFMKTIGQSTAFLAPVLIPAFFGAVFLMYCAYSPVKEIIDHYSNKKQR